jgi:DNA-binding response OmpR family regulator
LRQPLRHARQGRAIDLTPSEFELLSMLLANRNRLLSLPKIIQLLGKSERSVLEQTTHAWIGRLRRSLVKQGVEAPIRTVWAMGYIFDLPDDQ